MATTFEHLGLVFILMALSAPIAKAFRNVCSVFFSPTFKTSTVAPIFSLNQIALISPNSSLGLIINCMPSLSKDLFSSQKLIFEVVSGTWLIQTKIFIKNKNIRLQIYEFVIQ